MEGVITRLDLPDAVRFVGTFRDSRERRNREQQQQEFVSMIAHEMRTPLTAMRGCVDLMRKRGVYSERHMETVSAQVRRLNRLVNDALETSRLEAQRLELHPQETELVDVVRQSVEEARETEDGHTIRLDHPDRPIVGWWDPDRIVQVMQNLLMNTVKYSPAGSEIAAQVRDVENHAVIAVQDQGIGIPPEDLPRLFHRFYRAGNSTGGAGMGLGLYITKGLIEAHGGTITVASVLGEGSTFTVALPYGAPPAAAH